MKVVAYTGSWCGPSTMLKIHFKKEGIKFKNIDINGSLKESMEAGVVATPTIVLTNEQGTEIRLIGYNDVVLERVRGLINER